MPRQAWDGYRVIADYHTHTVHSHGRGTVLENARAAAARGLEAIAVADHGPGALPWVAVRSAETFDLIRKEARAARRDTGVTVLTAAECNVMSPNGDLDLAPGDLRRLDLALAGLHLMIRPQGPGRVREMARLVLPNVAPWKWSPRVRARARVTNTKALVEAVSRHRLAVVTHPGLHLPIDTRELARACARRGTCLEISSAHRETDEAYVRAAAREGVDFVLSSDAHRPERVGDLAAALRVAVRAGLPPERVRNVAGPGDPRLPRGDFALRGQLGEQRRAGDAVPDGVPPSGRRGLS